MARTKNYSDTMIGAMLSALTHQGADGRYQILTRGSTLTALETRGAAEMEETTDNYGRPVGHWYLTPAAVRNLRNGLVLMMGGSTSNATKMHREFVRSGWREAEAAARLILGDFEGAKLVTTTRREGRPHVVELGPADTIAQLANILSNGQPVHEHGTGTDGDEPAERLSAHLGGAVGAVTDFYIKRPAVEVEQVMYARHTGAHGFGWTRRVCEDNAASVRAALALARREGRAITVEDGGVIRVEGADMVDPGHDGAGEFCPVWFVPQRRTAPEPRPAAEVLAADPIPADTSVWEGMPGEPTGPGHLSTVDALTAEEYAVQVRSRTVWVLPNHDDGAHMTRAQVISAIASARRNSADHVRSAVDTDGTLYLSNGRQAARYIPVTLFADYSADHCPGCGTPYASNGDGPCPGKEAQTSGNVCADTSPACTGPVKHRRTPTHRRGAYLCARHGEVQQAPRMVATCCSCGVGIEKPMNGPRPACTHNGETRPNGGVVIAGTVVRPADPGTCYTDRHHVTDVPRWEARNSFPRCGECVAIGLGVSVDSLPGYRAPDAPAVVPGMWAVVDDTGTVLDVIKAEDRTTAEWAAVGVRGAHDAIDVGVRPVTVEEREKAASLAVKFLPQDPDDENTRPCMVLPTGEQVYVYREGGRLVVSVDLDTAEVVREDGTAPMVITVQGATVFEG